MASSENHVQAVDNRYITQVKIGDSFDTNRESLNYILSGADSKDELIDALPSYSLTAKRRDTMIGGNDAINCYYQFNEDDDIIHPINRTGTSESAGMGRVYNETFDEQQQILYLSFGLPDFTNANKFLENLYDTSLAALTNTGDVSVAKSIGQFLGQVLGTVIFLPFLPIKYAIDFLSSDSPSKYYDFKPTMALYYKTVNVILAHIAVNMNLTTTDNTGFSTDGLPIILKEHGLDILTILSRKHWYDDLATNKTSPTTDDILKKLAEEENSKYEQNMWEKMGDGAMLGFTEAMRYVGFRIEKSSDSSEQASNSTKEPDILAAINQQVSAGRERTFNLGAIRNTTVGSAVDSIYQGVMGVIQGAMQSINISGGAEVLKGAGFVDIPEIWASSSFQKSYSFDFQLRTPYGDPYSIFYSLYVPLAMIIAGAFPRSVGANTYTTPFLVRAYCQGMFAIPLGIIDSITIRRGAAEYGWTDASGNMLPTQIDVSFTVKDLSPIMHIAIADGGFKDWMSILGQNSSFQEYMLTLSGVNIAQRSLKMDLIKKRAKVLLSLMSDNKFNPMMFGFSLTNTKLGRAITALTPVSRVPGRVPRPQG